MSKIKIVKTRVYFQLIFTNVVISNILYLVEQLCRVEKNWAMFTFLVYLVNYCPDISVDKIDIFYF